VYQAVKKVKIACSFLKSPIEHLSSSKNEEKLLSSNDNAQLNSKYYRIHK